MKRPSSHYKEKYAQGVIRRDHSLELYDQFLANLGEKQPLEQLVHRVLRRKTPCRILDIGCGEGNALAKLKELYGERIHTAGIDLIPLTHKKNVDEFVEGDVHEAALPIDCDIILSFRSLHEMGGLKTLIPKLAHSLAKGGRAYLWIRMRDASEGNPEFVGEMNEQEEKDLHSLAMLPELNGCMLLLQAVEVPIPVTHDEDKRQSMIGGYIALLHKPL